jgi:1-acyl-sn-glycerol-3-phosphate acyltransferase
LTVEENHTLAQLNAESIRMGGETPAKKLKTAIYRASQWLCRGLLRLCFGCRYYGRENIPADGPLIVAANHHSYFDPPCVGAGVTREIHFMAKQELFDNPLFGALIRFYHAVPIRRGGMDWRGMGALRTVLADNGAVILFPQGTRKPEGTPPGKPKFGVGLLAQESGAAIVPVYTRGTGRLKDALLRRRPMRVCYGEPVRPEDYVDCESNPRGQLRIAELIMERIEELRKRYEAS